MCLSRRPQFDLPGNLGVRFCRSPMSVYNLFCVRPFDVTEGTLPLRLRLVSTGRSLRRSRGHTLLSVVPRALVLKTPRSPSLSKGLVEDAYRHLFIRSFLFLVDKTSP